MGADPVAEVELLDVVERVVAHHGLRHEQLDLAGPVADRGEDQLAGVAQQHDAPGDGDLVVGLGARLRGRPTSTRISASVWSGRTGTGTGSSPALAHRVEQVEATARSAANPLPGLRSRRACRRRPRSCSTVASAVIGSCTRFVRCTRSGDAATPIVVSTIAACSAACLLFSSSARPVMPFGAGRARFDDADHRPATATATADRRVATRHRHRDGRQLRRAHAGERAGGAGRGARRRRTAVIGRSASVGMTAVTRRRRRCRSPARASPTRWARPCCRSSRRRGDGPIDLGPAHRRTRWSWAS